MADTAVEDLDLYVVGMEVAALDGQRREGGLGILRGVGFYLGHSYHSFSYRTVGL